MAASSSMTWMTVLSFIVRLWFRERQCEFEHRSRALVGTRGDAAAMRLDDGPADRKTDAHSVRLAGYEGLKQLLRNLRCDAGAGVGDEKERIVLLLGDADRQLPPAGGFHRLDGIPDEVQRDLLD